MSSLPQAILFLGPRDSPICTWLKGQGESVIQMEDKITPEFIEQNRVYFLVSYGYRYILKANVLEKLPLRAINLHISYLPWNRGADPNLWSFIEDSPKGVTIHYLDEGVDTGDIITQREVKFDPERENLATSYEKLQKEIQDLFKRNWHKIKSGDCPKIEQVGSGSMHKTKDKEALSHLLVGGWNTPISALHEYVADVQLTKQFWDKYDSEIEELRRHSA